MNSLQAFSHTLTAAGYCLPQTFENSPRASSAASRVGAV